MILDTKDDTDTHKMKVGAITTKKEIYQLIDNDYLEIMPETICIDSSEFNDISNNNKNESSIEEVESPEEVESKKKKKIVSLIKYLYLKVW